MRKPISTKEKRTHVIDKGFLTIIRFSRYCYLNYWKFNEQLKKMLTHEESYDNIEMVALGRN